MFGLVPALPGYASLTGQTLRQNRCALKCPVFSISYRPPEKSTSLQGDEIPLVPFANNLMVHMLMLDCLDTTYPYQGEPKARADTQATLRLLVHIASG
jgi:hypothetical protein